MSLLYCCALSKLAWNVEVIIRGYNRVAALRLLAPNGLYSGYALTTLVCRGLHEPWCMYITLRIGVAPNIDFNTKVCWLRFVNIVFTQRKFVAPNKLSGVSDLLIYTYLRGFGLTIRSINRLFSKFNSRCV